MGDNTINLNLGGGGLDYDSAEGPNFGFAIEVPYTGFTARLNKLVIDAHFLTLIPNLIPEDKSYVLADGKSLLLDNDTISQLQANPGVTFSRKHNTDNYNRDSHYQETPMFKTRIITIHFLDLRLQHQPVDWFAYGARLVAGIDVSHVTGGGGTGTITYPDSDETRLCKGEADKSGRIPRGPFDGDSNGGPSAPPSACEEHVKIPVPPNYITKPGADEHRVSLVTRAGAVFTFIPTKILKLDLSAGVATRGDQVGGFFTAMARFEKTEDPAKPTTAEISRLQNRVTKGSGTSATPPATYSFTANKPGKLDWVINTSDDKNDKTVTSGSTPGSATVSGTGSAETISVSPGDLDPRNNDPRIGNVPYMVHFTFTPDDRSAVVELDAKALYVDPVITPAPTPEPDTTLEVPSDVTVTAGDTAEILVQSNKIGRIDFKIMEQSKQVDTGHVDIKDVGTDTPARIPTQDTDGGKTYSVEFDFKGIKKSTTLTINEPAPDSKTQVDFSLNRNTVSRKGQLDVTIKTPGLYKITVNGTDITSELGIIAIVNYDSNDANGKIIIPNPKESGKNAKIVRLNLAKIDGLAVGKTYDIVVTPVGKSADTLEATTKQFTVSGRTGTTRTGRGTPPK